MSSWPSVHTEYWLQVLSKRGHDVHFLPPDHSHARSAAFPDRVTVHRFSWGPHWRGINKLVQACELRYRLRQIKPDVFHVHSVFAVSGWLEFPWVFVMCTFHPLVLTPWGSDFFQASKTSQVARLFVRFAVRSADLITADAQSLLDVASEMGAPKERLHEIHFGVDTALFNPEVETAPIRAKLPLGSGPVVYSPRAFTPVYNQLNLVEAVPRILQVYPECQFLFKCRADHHSQAYEAQVRQRIETLGITHAVHIIPPLPYEQLPALYALSDVVVSIPEFDGSSRSVLEAMACGAFPVVSDVPALHEWIRDGDNGLFVRSLKAEQIAEAVLLALSSRDMLERAKNTNRHLVESRASTEYCATQLEALYAQVIH